MKQLNTDASGLDQVPNYCTHAAEFMGELAARLPEAGIRPDWEVFLRDSMQAAVKFLLPSNGYLFADHDFKPAMFDLQRLPYPLCALEFHASEELYAQGSDLHHAEKRIALCFDPHKLPGDLGRRFFSLIEQRPSELPPRCIAVTSVYCVKDMWGSAVGFVVVDLDDDAPVNVADSQAVEGLAVMSERVKQQIKGAASKHGLPSTFFTIPERARLVGQAPNDAFEALYIDTLDEVRVTYEFLAAINCANVGTQDVPAPAKLNVKRAKTGKTPFYPYKILDIAPASSGHQGSGGSTGSSPRTHLRRGHLRRLGEKFGNKVLWINATTVNAGGPLSTIYKVRAPNAL